MRLAQPFSTLRHLVEAFAARPDGPAVIAFHVDGPEALGYRRLHEEIRHAGFELQRKGILPGDRVLLWAPNSPAWITAYFAIVCSGATAIPLDNQMPAGDAARILHHCQPKLILSTAAHLALLRSDNTFAHTDSVLLDCPPSDPRGWPRSPPEPGFRWPDIETSHIASLLYTSGTTGTPKAVPLTHANFAADANALLAAELVDQEDRVLVPLPLHHTYPFTVGLLTVLGAGATVILPSGISGPEITRAAKEASATALIAVPRLCSALWNGIEAGVRSRGKWPTRIFYALLGTSIALRRRTGLRIGRALFRGLHGRVGPRMRMIGCGGAKLEQDLAWKLEGLGWQVLTGYGLTETSPVLTFNPRRKARLGTEGVVLAGLELQIAPQPGQAHGEILARGPNVFSGYWNNPTETRAAFTDTGWFRTGDVGWLDADGYLHIAGRSKEVIVLPDGKNVFPEDIEPAYAASPLFREVAILEHRGTLVALLVPDDQAVRQRGTLREAELLRDELERISLHLPSYQRVSDYRLIRTALPRTPLGKLRRHLLGGLYVQAAARQAASVTALTDEDRRLIASAGGGQVWQWLEARYADRALTLETSPQLDLHIDSLEWVSLTLEMERRFHVVLTGEAVSRILTLRDLLAEVQSAPRAGPNRVRRAELAAPNGALAAVGSLLLGLNRSLMRVAFRLRVRGTENLPTDTPFIITPNHSSYLDPPAIAAAIPKRRLRSTYWAGWVGKMYAGPISRLVSRATRVFPVDADRDLAGAIGNGKSVLESGHSLVWFPEGRRSPDGVLQRFQPGIGALLEETRALVVPAAVTGTFEAWPKGQRFPKLRPITVLFGAPLSLDTLQERGVGDSVPERVCSALQNEVASLLEEADKALAET